MSKKIVKLAITKIGSQVKTAELLNVTQQYVSNCVMRGFFPLVHAQKVANSAGIHVAHLLEPKLEKFAIDLVFPKDDQNYVIDDTDHPMHPAFGLV